MSKGEINLEIPSGERLIRRSLGLPRLEKSYSPKSVNRSPHPRQSGSEKLILPDIRSSKCSSRNSRCSALDGNRVSTSHCGAVYGYAVSSQGGISRNRNEDRVCIILNIPKPKSLIDEHWPRSSFFAIYDGHSGKGCANFLKENLHNYIFNDPNFPFKVKKTINTAFRKADDIFLTEAEEKGDVSGSCALIVLIIGEKCIIANTGNAHAVVSFYKGTKLKSIISIHNPEEENENKRIINAGGTIYHDYIINEKGETVIYGAARLSPGKLTVSRAFGDLDAKIEKYGGNPNVLIVDPEIKSFKISHELDFLMLATDSIFENLSYRDSIDIIWRCINEHKTQDLGIQLGSSTEELITETYRRQGHHNATVIIIAFKSITDNNHDQGSKA